MEKVGGLLGEEHPNTLSIMHDLALTYQAQGKNTDAAKIQEEVLEKKTEILGKEHPDTLATKNNLDLTYQSQDRSANTE